MKNAFNKALTSKEGKKKKIYKFGECQTTNILLYPLCVIVDLCEKAEKKMWKTMKWDEKRADRILRYAFPNKAEIDHENQQIGRYFRSWGFYWRNYCKWYDKKWCDKFNDMLKDYCVKSFEMEGFTKIVDEEDSEWTWVAFKKI